LSQEKPLPIQSRSQLLSRCQSSLVLLLSAAAVVSLLTTISPAKAQPRDVQQVAFDGFVAASVYEAFLAQSRTGLLVRLQGSLEPRSGGAMVVSLLVAPPSATAQPRDAQQVALDDFAAATLLISKCFSWQLDLNEAEKRFSDLNLQPRQWRAGGRHFSFVRERLSYYSTLVSKMSAIQACETAEGAFGPSGHIRKGWMRPQ
jgi:hypothetical protein